MSRYIDRLAARLRPHAQDLVDAYGFAPEHVRAPIASGAELERQTEARDYYSALAASGQAPVSEKSLKKKQEVRLVGFGTFSTSKRKAGKGRNPRTGEEIKIPASTTVRFKAGKGLKDAVN